MREEDELRSCRDARNGWELRRLVKVILRIIGRFNEVCIAMGLGTQLSIAMESGSQLNIVRGREITT